jgi:putative flippase GtrA
MTPFIRFNIVGAIGFGVQLGVLAALTTIGVPALPATCLAVEAALLHNFAWHERWTWADMSAGTRTGRLARFHLSNGFISILGNAAITTALFDAGAPLLAANVAAVVTCALLNFAAAHLWVFCAKTWPTVHGHLQ